MVTVKKSTRGEPDLFFALKEKSEIILQKLSNYSMTSTSHSAILSTIQSKLNTGTVFPSVIGNCIAKQVPQFSSEMTITLEDATGYVIVTVNNVPDEFIRREMLGPLRIDGVLSFSEVCCGGLYMVHASINFKDCKFISIDEKVVNEHNSYLKSIPIEHYIFENPFIEQEK